MQLKNKTNFLLVFFLSLPVEKEIMTNNHKKIVYWEFEIRETSDEIAIKMKFYLKEYSHSHANVLLQNIHETYTKIEEISCEIVSAQIEDFSSKNNLSPFDRYSDFCIQIVGFIRNWNIS